ncbi:GNAT family N-acetyltransferase [Anaerolineae bacterium CFX9]|jgi:ribosomal-protein-alanine N-acetyltransferase|nr:GNAT family N-acetyltransferase [Oscillatoria laete-virens]MDL1902922.1 GNAT family N-acetyltransferase [Anaerolineae bacterium CFX9]MDL5055781.1 GNAT family N-acetyltransferase [Oscillatoria laete-virens NRMC-F 0139]
MIIPTLITKRLILRGFTHGDLEAYHREIQGDAEVMRTLVGRAPRKLEEVPARIDYILNHWQDHGFGIWAVTERATGDFIGQAGLNMIEGSQDCEIAYALGKRFWGRGYATEAVRASIRYAFETAALQQLWGVAYPENEASRRVMTKAGMAFLGIQQRFFNTEMAVFFIDQTTYRANAASYRPEAPEIDDSVS